MRYIALSIAVFFAITLSTAVKSQSINLPPAKDDANPCLNENRRILGYRDDDFSSNSHSLILESGIPSSKSQGTSDSTLSSFVSVFVLPNLGPIGEAYTPDGLGNFIKVNEKLDFPFFFPSLFLDMSSSPLLSPTFARNEDFGSITKVSNADRELEWIDVTIKLFPFCTDPRTNQPKECRCKTEDCMNPLIRILNVLPNETVSETQDSIPTQISKAATDLASLSAPFFPASPSFVAKSEAAGKGLTVLFKNLFPPKLMTYQHAYVDAADRFGWNFKTQRKSENATNPSILGIHRGIAILQVRKDVTFLGVRYYALSRWNKAPNPQSDHFDLRGGGICLPFPQKAPDAPPKYNRLQNLDDFPLLINKDEVCKVLQIDRNQCDPRYDQLTNPANPQFDPNKSLDTAGSPNFVKKVSLEKYLGIKKQ